jgi:hypothetical protein
MKRRVLQYPLIILILALLLTYIVCWFNSVAGFGGFGYGALFWEGWLLVIWGCLAVGRSVMGVGLGVRRGVDDVAGRNGGRDRLAGVLDPREVQKQNGAFAMFGLVFVLTGVFLFVLHFV